MNGPASMTMIRCQGLRVQNWRSSSPGSKSRTESARTSSTIPWNGPERRLRPMRLAGRGRDHPDHADVAAERDGLQPEAGLADLDREHRRPEPDHELGHADAEPPGRREVAELVPRDGEQQTRARRARSPGRASRVGTVDGRGCGPVGAPGQDTRHGEPLAGPGAGPVLRGEDVVDGARVGHPLARVVEHRGERLVDAGPGAATGQEGGDGLLVRGVVDRGQAAPGAARRRGRGRARGRPRRRRARRSRSSGRRTSRARSPRPGARARRARARSACACRAG